MLRLDAVRPAHGFQERWLPVFLLLPVPLLVSQPVTRPDLEPVVAPVMLAAQLLGIASAWTLRRHFSVMVEARGLITGGPYRYIRHPIYAAHLLFMLGALALRWHPLNVLLYVAVAAAQGYRAQMEERKLSAAFPAYAAYQARVPMFGVRLPRFRRDRV